MKRLANLWAQLISFENLLNVFRKARRGKSRSAEIAVFELNLERKLLKLQQELHDGSYLPGQYRLFTIYERKPRQIAAAPFRDRVVHHAVMNCIEPTLDRTFIEDSYACRKGKGVHQAVQRYQQWSQQYAYALQLDIQQYFASVDHLCLKQKLRRRIKDRQILALLDVIIDGSPRYETRWQIADNIANPSDRRKGIPIGNLTSQFFANLYLDDLDHFIKQQLGVRAYLRYVDDMVLLDDSKQRLAEFQVLIAQRLEQQRLTLHPNKAHITPVNCGLNLLGYLVYPYRRRLRNDNGFRFQRRLRGFAKAYAAGRCQWDDINPSVQSWIGHARHADTYGLRKVIFSKIVFIKG